MTGLDWPSLLRLGTRGLGLTPDQFWALTPAEFRILIGAPEGTGPLLSDGLDALMQTYPDKPSEIRGNPDE